jgi:serine/threonine-protein kinase
MPHPIPETIGHYRVAREIGRGGMGVVYLGHDPKLDRPVAIKALAHELADDPERLARFEREARVLASLSHGNIATVYGLEEADGARYLVMEFVEGHTLADRLADGGALPINEALAICAQVAAGVEAAHEAGVVHRDLKPGNVIIRPDGSPKVLDFGLARELPPPSSRTSIEGAATVRPASAVTREGAAIGTPGYMSPEQVRGLAVDKRTDIFAFGCILYECLAGMLAFPGQTATDSIAAILEREPAWSALPASTPPTIQLLLRRCLQKDRRRRLRDIGDARIELEQAIDDPTSTSLGLASAALAMPGTTRPRPTWRIGLPWAIALLCAIAALAASWLASRPAPSAPRPVRKFAIILPEELPIRPSWQFRSIDLSADGRRLVFMGPGEPWTQLYIRDLDQLEARPLANTDGAFGPFLSPDGEWVAFVRDDKLMKISIRGGPATTLCSVDGYRGGAWGADGTIVFGMDEGGLRSVPAAGGEAQPLTVVAEGEDVSHRQPAFLPDGLGVLFAAYEGEASTASIVVHSTATGEQKTLVSEGKAPRYLPSGHVVFYREHVLVAAPLDLEALELTGPPVPVLEGVASSRDRAAAEFAFSDDGTLVYLPWNEDATPSLLWVDHTGKTAPISARDLGFRMMSLSPDDTHVVASVVEEAGQTGTWEGEIWILEIGRDVPRRATRSGPHDVNPVWSPDGRWIVFASKRDDGIANLYRIRSDLTGEPERLTTSEHEHGQIAFSPDGLTLAFVEERDDEPGDILYLRFDDEGAPLGEPDPLIGAAGIREGSPAFSPDGQWISYTSDESGSPEIYVRPLGSSGSSVRVSDDNGFISIWSPVEDVLYYWRFDRMLAVPYTTDDGSFEPDLPELMFEFAEQGPVVIMDISSDGTRFAGTTIPGLTAAHREITFVLNWFEELRSPLTAAGSKP